MKLEKREDFSLTSWLAIDNGRLVCYAFRKKGRKTIKVRIAHFISIAKVRKFLEFTNESE